MLEFAPPGDWIVQVILIFVLPPRRRGSKLSGRKAANKRGSRSRGKCSLLEDKSQAKCNGSKQPNDVM